MMIAQTAYYAGVMDVAMKMMRSMGPQAKVSDTLRMVADIGEESADFLSEVAAEDVTLVGTVQ